MPDILESGADTLVSIGGYQSNHTRRVAAVAAHLGLNARLVQERWVDWDDPVNDRVGNIELLRIMEADVRLDDAGFAEIKDAGGRARRVIGNDASATRHKTIEQVIRIANTKAEVIGLGRAIDDDGVIIRSG